MRKKSSPEKEKMQPSECDARKRCKLNVNQQNEEFISKEELHKRNGIAEGKNDYFTLYLQLFFKGIIIHGHSRSIRQHGHAMIAFHKQDGTSCLEQGTLVGYEKFFHRIYRITQEQESIVYWNMEQHAWRRFMIENLLEWKANV